MLFTWCRCVRVCEHDLCVIMICVRSLSACLHGPSLYAHVRAWLYVRMSLLTSKCVALYCVVLFFFMCEVRVLFTWCRCVRVCERDLCVIMICVRSLSACLHGPSLCAHVRACLYVRMSLLTSVLLYIVWSYFYVRGVCVCCLHGVTACVCACVCVFAFIIMRDVCPSYFTMYLFS